MCSLENFPQLPEGNVLPMCLLDGRLEYAPSGFANLHLYTSAVSSHPHIQITREMLHPSASNEDASRVFLPVRQTVWKHLQNAWYEKGLFEAVKVVADSDNNKLIQTVASYILSLSLAIQRFYKILLDESDKGCLDARGNDGLIRCLAWHPHVTKLAVGTKDDSVRIYSSTSELVPLLKSKSQRQVSCLAWRPLSASELAIGCAAGVLVWNIDPNSVTTRPSSTCVSLLTRPKHVNVASLAWSPNGDLLASCASMDRTMYLWSVCLEEAVPLRRVTGGPVSLLSWAPDSSKLMAATTSTTFRVWQAWEKWEPEVWTAVSGHVVATCWSSCASCLIFATSSEPFLYALLFTPYSSVFTTNNDGKTALKLADFTPVLLESNERVGGEVAEMDWDKKGRHLAVSFLNSELIAVFITDLSNTIRILPCCYIRGMSGEMPSVIRFQPSFQYGSNLTIAWSSGRVQYFPFLFGNPHDKSDSQLINASVAAASISGHLWS